MKKPLPPVRERRHLDAFWQRHAGQPILVAGKGPSAHAPTFTWPAPCLTIGVNDCELYGVVPSYLLVLDPPASFINKGPRHVDAIANTSARYLFASSAWHAPWQVLWRERNLPAAKLVKYVYAACEGEIRTGKKLMPPLHDYGAQLPMAGSSSFSAAALAGFMGARTVGLIGVDLTGHKKFGQASEMAAEQVRWARMRDYLAGYGTELVNLSADSALTPLPKVTIDEWLQTTRCA